ncbi:metallophosphoesterase family protein [Exiguobacterium antarcticum]|uniref:Metallophosphoesterase family protein n=1 Tax=Exiguobacterium antarcticum TaxID=132920 RepID=A0ABT6R220_9BACL|nr:metallophosphoesterase family protein [Exiguobacterium antarcticum]MDI3234992.1 metallophosphoesterase family protein [Exiguobacterium antarcticum]
MKFAVITDIHGNATALEAVLKKIREEKTVSEIFCLGDLIGIGPQTNEVIELVRSTSRMTTISGNHDENVLALLHDQPYPDSYRHAQAHHQWIADQLTPENQHFLEQLPRTIRKTFSGQDVLFTHYAYRDESKAIGEEPLAAAVDGTEETLPDLFKGQQASLICFGHHHPKQLVRTKGVTYLNPGALGCQPEAIAPFALVEQTEGGWQIDVMEVIYDDQPYLEAFHAAAMPEKELLRKLFLGGRT